MFDKNIISSKIAELRRSIPLTQAELADRLGISHQAVSQWERGETLPDITLLPELASLLGVDVNTLFGITASSGSTAAPDSEQTDS